MNGLASACLRILIAIISLLLMASPALAEDPGGGSEEGGVNGPGCGPNSAPDADGHYVPCQTEAGCEATTKGNRCPIDEEGFDPVERDGALGDVVCTGDEGRGAMITCTGPAPEAPEASGLRRITRGVDVACDAVAPPPEWDAAGLPAHTINHNPPTEGVTGLDTWLWASGEHAHHWTQTGTGETGRDVYAQDGVTRSDGGVDWGEEYLLAEQRWGCFRQAAFFARVVSWEWSMQGPAHHTGKGATPDPDHHEVASDRPGSEPPVDGDGAQASAVIMVETKGDWVIGLDTVWEADWGGAYRQSHPDVAYHVYEIRGVLLP